MYKPYTDYKWLLSNTWNGLDDRVGLTQNCDVSQNLILKLPDRPLYIPALHQLGVGRKHIAFSKGSLKRACKGASRVKATYEGWWGTRWLAAIGSCFIYYPELWATKEWAVTETQEELWPWERTLRRGAVVLVWREWAAVQPVSGELEEYVHPLLSFTTLWSFRTFHWTHPTGNQKAREPTCYNPRDQPPRARWREDLEGQMEDIPAQASRSPPA